MTKDIIVKLEIIVTHILSCWKKIPLSIKMAKIYGIEDQLLN